MSAPFTTAQDKLANYGMDQELIPRVLYSTGDGDQAIVAARAKFRFEAEKTDYVPGNTIRLDLGTTDFALDASRSEFYMDVNVTYTGDDTARDPLVDHFLNGNGVLSEYAVWEMVSASGTCTTTVYTDEADAGGAALSLTTLVKVGDIVRNGANEVSVVASTSSNTVTIEGANFTAVSGTNRTCLWRLNPQASVESMLRNGHVENFFSKIRVLNKRGQVLDEVENYAHIARLVRIHTMSEQEKIAKGHIQGMGVVPGNTPHYQMNKSTYYTFAFKLEALGFLNTDKFIPIYILDGIRFEFVLAPAIDALHYGGLTAGITYNIQNFCYETEMVEFSAGIKTRVASSLASGGIPLVVPSWSSSVFNIPSDGLTNHNLRIQENFTHATLVVGKFSNVSSAGLTKDNLGHYNPRIRKVQWRLGTQTMPDQAKQVDTDAEWEKMLPWLYNDVQKAWGLHSGKSNSVGDYQKFAYDTYSDGVDDTRPCRSEFSLALVLQSSPGIAGAATIIGDAADLQAQLKLHASNGLLAGQQIYLFVLHDKLVTVRPGGTIEINF